MPWSSAFGERTALTIGERGQAALAAARVAVFGLGGVGAACAVDLARVGIGQLVVCDFDTVNETNLNRLAFGYRRFIGRPKTEAFAEIALEINPEIRVEIRPLFIAGADAAAAIADDCDFYIDCIDSLNAKANLIASLARGARPFIASMGTAGRLDPSRLRYGSVWESAGCALARAVRQRLRRFGLDERTVVPCVWSDENAAPPGEFEAPADGRIGRPRRVQGSTPFVPQAAGILLAAWATRRLLEDSRGVAGGKADLPGLSASGGQKSAIGIESDHG